MAEVNECDCQPGVRLIYRRDVNCCAYCGSPLPLASSSKQEGGDDA